MNRLSFVRLSFTTVCVAALIGCGGGGSNSGAAASTSNVRGLDADGRVAYMWSFDNGVGALPGRAFLPVQFGSADQTLRACFEGSPTCSVSQAPGHNAGQGLRFDPSKTQSYAWLLGGDKVGVVCTGRVIQFGPAVEGHDFTPGGKQDHRMTVALWVNADKIESGSTYHLFGTQDPVGDDRTASFHLRLVNGFPTISLYPNKRSSPLPDFVMKAKTALAPNEWHHIAVVYQIKPMTMGGDELAMVSMYIDGKVDLEKDRNESALPSAAVSGPPSEPARYGLNESCEPYFLGGLTTIGIEWPGVGTVEPSPQGYIFPGVIDSLFFSNRALSAADIELLAKQ